MDLTLCCKFDNMGCDGWGVTSVADMNAAFAVVNAAFVVANKPDDGEQDRWLMLMSAAFMVASAGFASTHAAFMVRVRQSHS
jgi:hypothetical protein